MARCRRRLPGGRSHGKPCAPACRRLSLRAGFPMGLTLVVVAGADLFTSNCAFVVIGMAEGEEECYGAQQCLLSARRKNACLLPSCACLLGLPDVLMQLVCSFHRRCRPDVLAGYPSRLSQPDIPAAFRGLCLCAQPPSPWPFYLRRQVWPPALPPYPLRLLLFQPAWLPHAGGPDERRRGLHQQVTRRQRTRTLGTEACMGRKKLGFAAANTTKHRA